MSSEEPLYRDEDYLREQYWENEKSTTEIAEELGCAVNSVRGWMERHDIPRRSISEAKKLKTKDYAFYFMKPHGYYYWRDHEEMVLVHRLLAIAEYGFDEVIDKDVHHKNGLKWDNRPDNIELLSRHEHRRQHLKVDGVDRIRVAELYEHGEIASRPLGDMFDIAGATVLSIHDEFYGGGA